MQPPESNQHTAVNSRQTLQGTDMDIKELALRVALEVGTWQVEPSEVCFTEARLTDFATRFLAAIAEKSEPVAWMRTSGAGSPVITEEFLKAMPKYRGDFEIPLYTNPAIERLARQVPPDCVVVPREPTDWTLLDSWWKSGCEDWEEFQDVIKTWIAAVEVKP